jgi:hypothetical protein
MKGLSNLFLRQKATTPKHTGELPYKLNNKFITAAFLMHVKYQEDTLLLWAIREGKKP